MCLTNLPFSRCPASDLSSPSLSSKSYSKMSATTGGECQDGDGAFDQKKTNKTNGLERFNGNSFIMSEFLFETAFFFGSVDSSEILVDQTSTLSGNFGLQGRSPNRSARSNGVTCYMALAYLPTICLRCYGKY